MKKITAKIKVKGIVQGVGFRPFVHRLAATHNLTGSVLNSRSGVIIEVEGVRKDIEEFYAKISQSAPPLAVVETVSMDFLSSPLNAHDFQVKESIDDYGKFIFISPDVSVCRECREELSRAGDRRYKYPFINCTNCGPRFTIIRDVPYDRVNTTMDSFKMCSACREEYKDISHRRYHAQPNACPLCGPEVQLIKKGKQSVSRGKEAVEESIRLLLAGEIVAMKGLGGYHLACDARNEETVRELRNKKYREDKPFALMASNAEVVKEICILGEEEKTLLLSSARPIVLLKKKKDNGIAESIAPHQKYLGIMLPYTPLHSLLFENTELRVLVMTSGNISDEPIAYHDEEAISRLNPIADYFLTHNRGIYTRCDDSVLRIWKGKEMFLRRSRGYVPYPVKTSLPFRKQILACGADLKNAFCLTRDNYVFLSHHIGDLENMETFNSYREGIEHFKTLFHIQPELIVCDKHPGYHSSRYAEEFVGQSDGNLKLVKVQHHHAHIASCMADNGIEGEKTIGVAFDGTGYGDDDGTIWGGEFLVADFKSFQRRAHFRYLPMPGGEKAVKEPWRMAISYLYQIYGHDCLETDFVKERDSDKCRVILNMLKNSLNCSLTSSAGRLFDAVSSLLGIRDEVNYEGQAAVELEMIARQGSKEVTEFYEKKLIQENSTFIIDPCPIIIGIIDDLKNKVPVSLIAAKFHLTLARTIREVCDLLQQSTGLNKVTLSGGVFQNLLLLNQTYRLLDEEGFKVYTHHKVPPNDGGISLGQAVIADRRIGD